MKTSLSRPTIFARTLKRVRFSTAAFAILAGTLAIGLAQAQENIPAPAVEKVGSPSSPEEQGRRLAVAGDCMACHTVPDSDKPFAGGYAINSPFGAIFSTNITPSKQAGIGLYTEQEFAEAVRKGIRRDGGHLYPAMPYTSYVHMTDSDVSALYAYFMHSVEPVDVPAPKTALAFPFNLRFSMIGWNLLFLDNPTTLRAPLATPQIQRGEYLTNTLEHCGACHTPRNPLMAEITSKALSGGMVGPWFAPNITSDPISGIGGWTDAELIGYLRTGHATGKAQAGGGMAEAVQNSLQFLPDGDLAAIVAYLKSTAPVRMREKPDRVMTMASPIAVRLSSGELRVLPSTIACIAARHSIVGIAPAVTSPMVLVVRTRHTLRWFITPQQVEATLRIWWPQFSTVLIAEKGADMC
jgi:mono/diheme cytochrome c family protein